MSVGFVSVFPPVKSGIADYSALLANNYNKDDLIAFCEGECEGLNCKYYNIEKLPKMHKNLDRIIYNIGNNMCHIKTYEMFFRFGGDVILHDLNIHTLLFGFTAHKGNWKAYERVMKHIYGDVDISIMKKDVSIELKKEFMKKYTTMELVIDKADKVYVHSKEVQKELKHRWGDKVKYLPFVYVNKKVECISKEYKKMIVVPGIGSYDKCMNIVVKVSNILEDFEFIFAGECIDPAMKEDVEKRDNCYITGYLSENDLLSYIKCADIVIVPRCRGSKEMSAIFIQSLGMGKITISSDVPGFKFFDSDDFIWFDPGIDEKDMANLIENVYNNKEKWENRFRNIREYILENHSPAVVWDVLSY